MQGIDKLRKVLIIIFTTLSIIALVFSLCKKVGLCASDSSSSLFPIYVEENNFPSIANYSYSDYVEDISSASQINVYDYFVGWYNSNSSKFVFMVLPRGLCSIYDGTSAGSHFLNNTDASLRISSGQSCYYGFAGSGYVRFVYYTLVDGNLVYDSSEDYGFYTLNTNTVVNRKYFYIKGNITNANSVSNYESVFQFRSGHGTGGSLADPSIDWGAIDQVLNTTTLIADTVDNTWTNLTFWQKILLTLTQGFNNIVHIGQWLLNNLLSFFKPIFDSILNVLRWFVSFFNNLFSLLQTSFSSILDFFQSIHDLIEDIEQNGLSVLFPSNFMHFFNQLYNLGFSNNEFAFSTFLHNLCFCSPQTIISIWNNSQTGASITALKNCASSVISCYNASPAQHVYWTFDFSNTLLGNAGVITIDFDWYNNIRTQVITVFSVFFVLGFIFLWLRKLPGIISGASSNSDDK